MKLAPVALSALAISLAACTTANAEPVAVAPLAPPAAAAEEYPLTPQGAADWVAMVEKKHGALIVDQARIDWINATYITEDTNALAAEIGGRVAAKSVENALQAAKYAEVQGSPPMWRANSTSCAPRSTFRHPRPKVRRIARHSLLWASAQNTAPGRAR